MKKIAYIYLSNYEDWPLGGMLNYTKNLLPYLENNQKWDLEIWGGEVKGTKNNNVNINIYTNILTTKKLLPNFLRSFFSVFVNRTRFKKYDIIYSHTAATSIALKICYPKKFVVHHQHGLSYKDNRGYIRILNIGYSIAQLLSNVTLFVASEEDVRKHKDSKIFKNKKFYSIGSPIDYMGIEKKSKKENNSEVKNFIYTGRIDEWKNIDLLLESFIEYHKIYSDSLLYIIGDGPDFEVIEKKIKYTKSSDYIILTGRKSHSEIVEYLSIGDVFLFPSKGEGVSLSILEAFSAGLPVVGFNVTGVRDLVINNETGILVDDMNVNDFKLGIIEAYNKKEELSKKCKKFASNFDSSKIENKISEIIDLEYRSYIDEQNSY